MKKTAIIGASGYIGSHLLKKYRETFPDCIGTGFSQLKPGLTRFDLCHPDVDTLKLQETGHEAVLIASAKPNIGWCEAHPEESYALNVKGTLELVKQLDKLSISVIFYSTDYVFNGEEGQYSDIASTSPVTEYGRQKAEVERELPNITKNFTILRLSKIYGTVWKDNTLIDGLAADLLNGKTLTVATDQFFSPTHVNDVIAMTLYSQEKSLKGLYNLCNSHPYSRHQIARLLVDALDVSPSLLKTVSLRSIPGMENRPLNTSLVCSSVFQSLPSPRISVEESVNCVAANWSACEIS